MCSDGKLFDGAIPLRSGALLALLEGLLAWRMTGCIAASLLVAPIPLWTGARLSRFVPGSESVLALL